MTLSLVTAPADAAGPVSYPSGLIVFRCEDYVGGARGTLSTVADADSLSGTVIKDEQALSLVTTNGVAYSTRWAAASDTISIPWATITGEFPANTTAAYFCVSMKVTGDTATGGDALASTHLRWAKGGNGPGMAIGRDTTLLTTSGISVWRSVWGGQYMISSPVDAFINVADMTGTNFVFRVWGITGGDLAFYIDTLYVTPVVPDFGRPLFPSDFPVMDFAANGTMAVDLDTDPADVPFAGDHSVTGMAGNPIDGLLTFADIQHANDEITYYDATVSVPWTDPPGGPGPDPRSWLSLMAAPIYLPAQNLISDPFDNSHIIVNSDLIVSTPSRFTKRMTIGTFHARAAGDGVSEDSGHLRVRLTGNQTAPTPIETSFWPRCVVYFGHDAVITGETNTPDHNHPLLDNLEDCVQTFSFDTDTLGDYRIMCGQTALIATAAASETRSHGAFIEMDGSGNLDLSLVSSDDIFVPTLAGSGTDARTVIDGPVNITGSFTTGTTYWVKLERQRYFLRAKCWADGDTEPDWQVQGFMYLVATDNGGANQSWVAYPYNTNWVGNANHDLVRTNPTDQRGLPFIFFETGFSQAAAEMHVYQYDLDVDPEGADLGDMHVHEEKYDGTAWDAVTVPYMSKPCWRFIEGDLRQRSFNTDADGFNLRVWQDPWSPSLQQGAIPWVFFRGILPQGVIPLFRPRVFSVSAV